MALAKNQLFQNTGLYKNKHIYYYLLIIYTIYIKNSSSRIEDKGSNKRNTYYDHMYTHVSMRRR